jgi:ankyrin repeat protein
MRYICANIPKELLGTKDAHGDTALHIAARHEFVEICRTLVGAGAPTDATDARNYLPADVAQTTKNKDLCKILAYEAAINDFAGAGMLDKVEAQLRKKADVDRRDKDGRTPLMAACLCKQEAVVGTLVDNRADVNAKDRAGFSAVAWLLDAHSVDSPDTLKILRTLINSGLDVKDRVAGTAQRAGGTALILASAFGFTKAVGQLIAASSEVNAKDKSGKTALMFAVTKGHTEVVQELMEARADPMAQDEKGFTPSTVALGSNNTELRAALNGKKK